MKNFKILPINELLDKLEQFKAKNRDLLTIEDIQLIDETIARLESCNNGSKLINIEDLTVIIRLLLELFTGSDWTNNM